MNNQMELLRSSAIIGFIGCAAFLVSNPTFAVWGYSLAAKLAMFDGLEEACQHLVAALFDEVKGHLIYLTPDEKLEASHTSTSAEYTEVLQEMRKTAFSPQSDDHEKIKECTNALSLYKLP